jgi:hypothetical protein
MSTIKDIHQALAIFEAYDAQAEVNAENNELIIGPFCVAFSQENQIKLEELGWFWDDETNIWFRKV